MEYAPIALFTYKRPHHTRRTIESLKQNPLSSSSKLFLFSDAPKSEKDKAGVNEVREYLTTVNGFEEITIIERDGNFGLAKSIITGVTGLLEQYPALIILEDDMVLSPHFLQYMNDGLNLYADDPAAASIHGYIYPVRRKLPETFFLRGADCWGWATWRRAWKYFEPDSRKLLHQLEEKNLVYAFNYDGAYDNLKMLRNQLQGKIDSWAIRWHASAFLNNMYTLYPGISLVQNIGTDGNDATHFDGTESYDTALAEEPVRVERIAIEENYEAREAVKEFLFRIKPSFLEKVQLKLKSIFKK
jgi:hypothetical protein